MANYVSMKREEVKDMFHVDTKTESIIITSTKNKGNQNNLTTPYTTKNK